MSSVRLSPQSTNLLPTFVTNPYDPLDIKDSGKPLTHSTPFLLSHEEATLIEQNQTSVKDQIDPKELQSLLKAIKSLNAKPKTFFDSVAKWSGPIITLLSCAATAYAYLEYNNLSNQHGKCQNDLMNATQNANLIPLTVSALFPETTDFVATTANTLFNWGDTLETSKHCTYDKKESIDPVTGQVTHRTIHCILPALKQPANNLQTSLTEPGSTNSPTTDLKCTEQVAFDQHHYNMNVTADCKGTYLTTDSKPANYSSHEEFVFTSEAEGPNSILHVEHTLCESKESDGKIETSCNTYDTETTIDQFSKANAKRDILMLEQILSALKA